MSDQPEPYCPSCGRRQYLTYDGEWWTTCAACGCRHNPGAMRRAIEREMSKR